jgi:hypothetical protein
VANLLHLSVAVDDRRTYTRRQFSSPVNVSTDDRKDRGGMARDLSATGIAFRSRSRYAVGERVVIKFRTTSTVSATGRVVRVGLDDDLTSPLPFVTAVQFDVPHLDLAA